LLEERIVKTPGVLRVNVIDLNFGPLQKYLNYIRKTHGDKALEQYYSISTSDHVRISDLISPYFAVSLIFTNRFEHDQAKLDTWICFSNKLEKEHSARLRVSYKVTRVESCLALDAFLGSLEFRDEEKGTGQWRFVKNALQMRFAPPVEEDFIMDGNVNEKLFADFPVVDGEEDEVLRRMFADSDRDVQAEELAELVEGDEVMEVVESIEGTEVVDGLLDGGEEMGVRHSIEGIRSIQDSMGSTDEVTDENVLTRRERMDEEETQAAEETSAMSLAAHHHMLGGLPAYRPLIPSQNS